MATHLDQILSIFKILLEIKFISILVLNIINLLKNKKIKVQFYSAICNYLSKQMMSEFIFNHTQKGM